MATAQRSDNGYERRIAARIRALRDHLHWTAQQLSDRVTAEGGRLTRQAISKIENGDRAVSLVEAIYLCSALEVPIADFVSPEPLVLRTETRID